MPNPPASKSSKRNKSTPKPAGGGNRGEGNMENSSPSLSGRLPSPPLILDSKKLNELEDLLFCIIKEISAYRKTPADATDTPTDETTVEFKSIPANPASEKPCIEKCWRSSYFPKKCGDCPVLKELSKPEKPKTKR
jgi:hypothetical protein